MEHDTRHPDHGDGLHEDLVKLASRRDALRIFGAGGAAAILATLGASQALAATPTAEVPERDRRPVSRATAPTAPTCSTTPASCATTSAAASAAAARSRGRPAARQPDRHRRLQGLRADGRRRRLPVALRPRRQVLDVLVRASRTRTTCAGSRRPTATAPPGSGRSSRLLLRAAGRTSTSRSTRRSPRRSPTARSSRPRRSRCRRRRARRSTRRAATRAARATSRRTSLSSDMVFSDDKAIHQLATVTGSVKEGYMAGLTVAVRPRHPRSVREPVETPEVVVDRQHLDVREAAPGWRRRAPSRCGSRCRSPRSPSRFATGSSRTLNP